MRRKNNILHSIKNTVRAVDSTATIILYGSFARGDNNLNSDIDLLILLDKKHLYMLRINYGQPQ